MVTPEPCARSWRPSAPRTLFCLFVLSVVLAAPGALRAQPANDTCANATPVFVGVNTFDTTGATTGTGASPSCDSTSGNDVWFTFNTMYTGTYALDTVGSSFNAALTVYTPTCVPGILDEIACNSSTNQTAPQARTFFTGAAGNDYLIRVSGRAAAGLPATGAGVLNIIEVAAPTNDDCASPITISIGGTVDIDTTASTTSTTYSCPMGPDLWYEVTAPGDGVLIVDKDVLYQHSIYPIAAPGACPTSINDEIYCSLQEHTAIQVTGGQSYLIRVAPNIQDSNAAIGTLTVDFQTIAANDECTQPESFPLGATLPIDCVNATLDPSIEITCNPPPFGDNLLYADLWYEVTAPFDGVLIVNLSNDPEATPYHVIYDGAGCPTIGDELQCSQPSNSSTAVTAGQTLVIRIGTSFDAQFYRGDLTIDVIASNNNDDCTGATPLVSGNPEPVDTTLASISNGYSCVIEGDLWYEFMAPADGFMSITLDLTEIGSHVIYHAPGGSGTCPTDADELVCGQFTAFSSVAVTGGEWYSIRLSGTQFAGPAIGTIQADFFSLPSNDDCATPDGILGPGIYPFSTIAATGTPGLASNCTFPIDKDVWFSYTAPANGTLFLDFDTNQVTHALYTRPPGGGCPAASDNIMCVNAPFLSNTTVTGGQEYLIRVGAPTGSPGTAGNMTLDFAAPPANDDCTGAIPIATIPSTTAWDTAGANNDLNGLTGGPGCAFGPFDDVWFAFVAPATGLMEFRFTVGGSGWSSFVIYDDLGNPCPTDADAIACRQGGDVDTFTVIAGSSYFVRVGKAGATSQFPAGEFQLEYLLADPAQVVCDSSVPDQITGSYVIPAGSDYDLGVEVSIDGALIATIPQAQGSYTHLLPTGTIGVVSMGFRGLSSTQGATATITCNAAFGAPANDLCAQAIPIGVGTVAFDNSGTATDSTAPPFDCGQGSSDLWYTFVAPNSALYRASTCGTTQFDSVIEIYDGSGGCPTFTSTPITCNDFASNCPLNTAEAEWNAVAGETYYVRLGGGTAFNGSTGTGDLTIQEDCFDVTGLVCDYDCATNTLFLSWDAGGHIEYSVEASPGGVLATGLTTNSYVGAAPVSGAMTITVTGLCSIGVISSTFCEVTAVDLAFPTTDLILDLEQPSGAVSSAPAIASALLANGLDSSVLRLFDFDSFPCLDTLTAAAERIWVVNGTYPNDYHLTEAEGNKLVELIDQGLHVYLEGADHWGFLHVPSGLDAIDGVTYVADGDASLTTLIGVDSGLVGGDLSAFGPAGYNFDGGGSGIMEGNDQLDVELTVPDLTAGPLWKNQPDGQIGETDYTVSILAHRPGKGAMLSSSFEFGGYSGDRDGVMAAYLAALNTPAVVGEQFRRGDCNHDGSNNIADAIALLGVLFPSGGAQITITCEDACDANDDEGRNIADAIAILNSLFAVPAVPLPPPSSCGVDPTDGSGALDCGTYLTCP